MAVFQNKNSEKSDIVLHFHESLTCLTKERKARFWYLLLHLICCNITLNIAFGKLCCKTMREWDLNPLKRSQDHTLRVIVLATLTAYNLLHTQCCSSDSWEFPSHPIPAWWTLAFLVRFRYCFFQAELDALPLVSGSTFFSPLTCSCSHYAHIAPSHGI